MNIYIDGSNIDLSTYNCGGWSYVVEDNEEIIHTAFGKLRRGNQNCQRGELEALYQALLWINKYIHDEITIHTDYEVIVKCLNGSSKRTGNRDLWEKIEPLAINLIGKIKVKHIKSHAGNKYNELADKLARQGANSLLIAPINN